MNYSKENTRIRIFIRIRYTWQKVFNAKTRRPVREGVEEKYFMCIQPCERTPIGTLDYFDFFSSGL